MKPEPLVKGKSPNLVGKLILFSTKQSANLNKHTSRLKYILAQEMDQIQKSICLSWNFAQILTWGIRQNKTSIEAQAQGNLKRCTTRKNPCPYESPLLNVVRQSDF